MYNQKNFRYKIKDITILSNKTLKALKEMIRRLEISIIKPLPTIFLLDVHSNNKPNKLKTILQELKIKKIAFLQEHWYGNQKNTPRKDKYYNWYQVFKIPENIIVHIFKVGPDSGTYGINDGDDKYKYDFLRLLEKYDNFNEYDAIIINTGHSYPIAISAINISNMVDIYDIQIYQKKQVNKRHKLMQQQIITYIESKKKLNQL